jgi:hypothetical protein
VVDEVKRMKIICEILRMPEDEPGIARLVGESAAALEKLQEVAPGRSEAQHYGKASGAAAAPAASAGSSNLAVPVASHPGGPQSPNRSASPIVPSSPSRSPTPAGPPPTLQDYKTASVPALAAEMYRRKAGALEELDDRCVTSDNANDFMTVGGIEPLLISTLSKYDGLRWRAAQALGTMVQNNPKAQEHAFTHRALDYLLPMLEPPSAGASAAAPAPSASSASMDDTDPVTESWTVVVKALTAISALVRSESMPAIRDAFMAQGGLQRLVNLLQYPATTARVQTKLFLLLKHILCWYPAAKAHFLQLGGLKAAVKHVGTSSDIGHRESCLRLLLEFARKSGTAADQAVAKELRKKEYGLKETLAARIKTLKGLKAQDDKDQAEEELALCHALVKACKF